MRHPDDPGRHRHRHHRGHGLAHQDRHRRAHASTDRHRGCRRPAWASCPGSDEAYRPDADRLSHPDEACGCRCFRVLHQAASFRPRQDAGRGDERPCPATTRTGCCQASARQDGGWRCSAKGRPDAEPPDVAKRSVPEVAEPGMPGAAWMSWGLWMPRTAGPAMAGPRRAPVTASALPDELPEQGRVLLQPAWAEQREQSAPQRRQPDGSEPLQGQGQQSPGARARQRSPTFRGPCAPRGPQGLTRRTGRIRPCR